MRGDKSRGRNAAGHVEVTDSESVFLLSCARPVIGDLIRIQRYERQVGLCELELFGTTSFSDR